MNCLKGLEILKQHSEISQVEMIPSKFEGYYYQILYKSDGSLRKGFIALPENFDESKSPLLIYYRAGFGKGSQFAPPDLFKIPLFVSMHYMVVAPEYPLNQNGEEIDLGGKEEVNAAINLIKIGQSLYHWDQKNLFAFGRCRGAIPAWLAAEKLPFTAICLLNPLVDLNEVRETRSPGFLEYISAHRQKLKNRSIVNRTEKIKPPCSAFLLGGVQDTTTPIGTLIQMSENLQKKCFPHKLMIYEKGSHHFSETIKGFWFKDILMWFENHRDGSPFQGIESVTVHPNSKRPNIRFR